MLTTATLDEDVRKLHRLINEQSDRIDREAIPHVMVELIKEISDIAKQRHVGSAAGLVGIFRQQDDVWKAACRQCPFLNPTGFKASLHKLTPMSVTLYP
jgi:hypothetical protein